MDSAKQGGECVVYVIDWEEFEQGWGRRPDGVSLHASPQACADYLREFYAQRFPGPVPKEYEQPVSDRPRAARTTPEIAALVALGVQRLGRGMVEVKDGLLTVDHPQFLADAQRALLDQSAGPAMASKAAPRV